MQYANVVINHKAGYEPLTYAIPPSLLAHIEVGSVVLVPFGHQTVHGVIEKFVKTVSPTLSVKLKPVESVVYPNRCIDEARIEAARLLHVNWGLSYGQTLFRLLPDLPKKRQTIPLQPVSSFSRYQVIEYQIPLPKRFDWYKRIFFKLKKTGLSMLVITSNQAATTVLVDAFTKLKLPVIYFPSEAGPKAKREYWLKSMSPGQPTIFIGSRGAIITSVAHVGTIIVDEPWFPGHKEDMSPKLWSVFAANALCQTKKIPLLLVSSLLWPESRLLPIKRSHKQLGQPGSIRLTPKKNLPEQITHWLGDTEHALHRTIVIHESNREILWCGHCQKSSSNEICPKCGHQAVILPRMTEETVAPLIKETNVTLCTTEQLWFCQPTSAILALNFDSYLGMTDFRSGLYTATLLHHLCEQSQETFLATSHPDTWTKIIQKYAGDYYESESAIRREHSLPPNALLIRLSALELKTLDVLLPFKLPELLKTGKIHRVGDHFALTLLVKPNAALPQTWSKTPLLKVDIMPLYFGE